MMNYEEHAKIWMALSPEKRDHIRWRFFGETSPHTWETGPYEKSMDAVPILDKGWIALKDHMGYDLDVVNAARVSFQEESESFDDNDNKLLRYLMKHRHTSPFEMVEFKFVVRCPIFVARQWHRHRTWSYNEVSRRYTSEDQSFYTPPADWIRKQAEKDRQASDEAEFEGLEFLRIQGITDLAEDAYEKLLKEGVAREQARMVLPQNMYTTFYAKTDLSNLLHFIDLRMDPHAQWEIQQYGEAIVELIRPIVPATIDAFMENRNAKED